MVREKSGRITNLKIILSVPVVIFLAVLISSCEKIISDYSALKGTGGIPTVEISPVEIKAPQALKKPVVTTAEEAAPPQVQNSLATKPATAGNQDVRIEESRTEPAPSEVFVVVEEMPSFPGGEKALMEFIYRNIQYPEEAKLNGIEGRVILRFCITSQGYVDRITVIKGVHPALDEEARRVIAMLPQWKPGRQGGKPVNVWYSVPVTFQLK